MYFSAIVDTIRDNVFDNVLLFAKVFLHFISKSFRLSRYIISLCKNIIDMLKNDYIIIQLFYIKIFQQIRKNSVCVDHFILQIVLIFCRYIV